MLFRGDFGSARGQRGGGMGWVLSVLAWRGAAASPKAGGRGRKSGRVRAGGGEAASGYPQAMSFPIKRQRGDFVLMINDFSFAS